MTEPESWRLYSLAIAAMQRGEATPADVAEAREAWERAAGLASRPVPWRRKICA